MSNEIGFNYVDLNQIDPNLRPVPSDVYKLEIIRAELAEFTYKKNQVDSRTGDVIHAIGDTGEYIKFRLAVVDHDEESGRVLFESLFFGQKELRWLRRLMDATGVAQNPGETLAEWLKQLTEAKPTIKVPVEEVEDKRGEVGRDGKKPTKNVVKWGEVMPA